VDVYDLGTKLTDRPRRRPMSARRMISRGPASWFMSCVRNNGRWLKVNRRETEPGSQNQFNCRGGFEEVVGSYDLKAYDPRIKLT